MEYTRQEEIIELLKTKSNQYFAEYGDLLEEYIYESTCKFNFVDEDENFPIENILPEKVAKFIIRDCIVSLYEMIRWYVENPDYWENVEQQTE